MNWMSKLVLLLLVLCIIPGIWVMVVKLEGEKPRIKTPFSQAAVGGGQELRFTATDEKNGLRSLTVSLTQKQKTVDLFQRDFPPANFLGKGGVHEATAKVRIDAQKLKIDEGEATLRAVAQDYAWRRWGHGNKTVWEQTVQIDTRPPRIAVLSTAHNLRQGGAGLVIYRLSEPCPQSGVLVGKEFFPGRKGPFSDPNIFLAFIALAFDQPKDIQALVQATDLAGNRSQVGFAHYFRERKFDKDIIHLSDGFLEKKMPEFGAVQPVENAPNPLVGKFLTVNREYRKKNTAQLRAATEQSDPTMHWRGEFIRLPGSARRASFADYREYLYKEELIDEQTHMGVDLASIQQAPIPAANAGRVAFVGNLGIYGNTAVIDHGLGLFSVYSHLSSFAVTADQMVEKDQTIGRTGETGMAGGDHLHFGMLIHQTFVNPVEWWDGRWIRHNITDKIEAVRAAYEQQESGEKSNP